MGNQYPMKTIFPKFKINNISYFVFLSFLLTGYIKNALLIFLIILVHELGHVLFIRAFLYEIECVEIFPFGGMTTTKNKPINSPINKDIIIYFGGIFFQSLLYGIFFFLYKEGGISTSTFKIFNMYNKSIFLFNLLPIRPLDGGEILNLFLEKYTSYKNAFHVTNVISLIVLVIFSIYTIKSGLNNYIVIFFLLYKTSIYIKRKAIYQNKFLLERYLYTFPYKKIEHDEIEEVDCLKKETLHFFKKQNKYVHEKEILQRKFDIHDYF